jgi:hypothetical protein
MARRKRRRGPVVLKRGLGKDGGLSPYTIAHPTNYVWRDPDVEAFTRHLVNIPRFKGKIWINTYYKHPPVYEGETDIVSFDVWGSRGAWRPATRRYRPRGVELHLQLRGPPGYLVGDLPWQNVGTRSYHVSHMVGGFAAGTTGLRSTT